MKDEKSNINKSLESKPLFFEGRKISSCTKFVVGEHNDDFLRNELTAQLSAFVYERTKEKRELVHYLDRPRFLDWLLRRRKKVTIIVDFKEWLINPPIEDYGYGVISIAETKIKNDE